MNAPTVKPRLLPTAKPKAARSTARPPAFLIVGNRAISLAIVRQAWQITDRHVVIELTRGSEVHIYGSEAGATWRVILAHKASAVR